MSVPCILAGVAGRYLSERTIRVEINGVGYTVQFPVLEAEDLFYLSGDGSDTDAIQILEDTLNDQLSGESFILSQDGNGHILFDCDIAFRILGAHADTTVELAIFGLDNTNNHPAVAADNYEVPRQHGFGFFPLEMPDGDGLDSLPLVATSAMTCTGRSRVIKLSRAAGRTRMMEWRALDAALVRDEYADDEHRLSSFETTWNAALSEGDEFRFYLDTTDRAAFKTYQIDLDRMADLPFAEAAGNALFWDVRLAVIRTDD